MCGISYVPCACSRWMNYGNMTNSKSFLQTNNFV